MKGASASRARRRAISVLPTPVGPIMRMFLGVISGRSFSSTCWRRQRLRKAMATARLAPFWPMMKRSSSETISWGVMEDIGPPHSSLRVLRCPPRGCELAWGGPALRSCVSLQGFDRVVHVGVDADLARVRERLMHHLFGIKGRVLVQGAGGGVGIGPARADGHHTVLGLQHVAVAGDDQRGAAVGHR